MTFYRRHRSRRPPRGVENVGNTVSGEGTAILCFPPDGAFFRGLLTTRLETSTPAAEDDSPYVLYGRETPCNPGQYKVTVADLETGAQHHLNSVLLRGKLKNSKTPPPATQQSSAIPINHNPRLISMNNSPNFDNIFMNESCPAFHHDDFPPELNVVIEEEREDHQAGTSTGGREIQTFEENICSSFSDIADNSPLENPKYISSLSETSSSRNSLSPNPEKGSPPCPAFSLEYEEEQNVLQFTASSVYRGQKADMMIQQFMAGSRLVGAKCVVLVGPLRFSVNDAPFVTNGTMAWSL